MPNDVSSNEAAQISETLVLFIGLKLDKQELTLGA